MVALARARTRQHELLRDVVGDEEGPHGMGAPAEGADALAWQTDAVRPRGAVHRGVDDLNQRSVEVGREALQDRRVVDSSWHERRSLARTPQLRLCVLVSDALAGSRLTRSDGIVVG